MRTIWAGLLMQLPALHCTVQHMFNAAGCEHTLERQWVVHGSVHECTLRLQAHRAAEY
jgi:hypothetical protein